MLVGTIDSVPGHFMEFVAITVNGPTINFARCECDWESVRDQVPLDVVEAAARRHLEQSSSSQD
jgi:hypothetical protein